jgi:CBS domain-containing protein
VESGFEDRAHANIPAGASPMPPHRTWDRPDGAADLLKLDHDLVPVNSANAREAFVTQFLARDLMVAEVVTVAPSMRAGELARLFVNRGVATVAVVDAGGTLKGIVTESDLIRRLADEDEQPRKGWLALLLEAPHADAKRYARSHAVTAGDLMTPEVVKVGPGDSAAHVARLMEEHKIRRVLVMELGELLGLVSRADLVRALVAPIGETPFPTSDEDIRLAVLASMNQKPWARELGTAVAVQDGVVEFSGFSHSEATSLALRVLAENIPGVTGVVDRTVPLPVLFAG